MMGDPLASTKAKFTARVLGGARDGADRKLVVLRDGTPIAEKPVRGNDFVYRFSGAVAGNYRLQLERGEAIDGLTNPITLGARPLRISAAVAPRRARAGRRTRFFFAVDLRAEDRATPLAGALIRFAGKRTRTDRAGRASISARIEKPGTYRATIEKQGLKRARLTVRVTR
jgi:hypothetical protein